MPEVSLVAILDADKEGFLRSERSLIQTIGRAARNLNGKAILYADRMTDSMKRAIGETERRRAKQIAHNVAHGITPTSVVKQVKDMIDGVYSEKSAQGRPEGGTATPRQVEGMTEKDLGKRIKQLEKQMLEHAAQPRVREGGAGARPAGGAARAGVRRLGHRQRLPFRRVAGTT